MASVDDLAPFDRDPVEFMLRGEEMMLEIAKSGCPAMKLPFGVGVFSRELVNATLRDRKMEARIIAALLVQGITEGQLYDNLSTSILNMNGPEHQRLRQLVLAAFTPTRIERLRPAMRTIAHELIDTFAAAGEVEFMEQFANQYPVQVICTVLGVPRGDRHLFRAWLDEISFGLSALAAARRESIEQAQRELNDYLRSMIDARRANPGDDLITALLAAEDEGDRLTHDEVVRMTGGLLFAGHDTTRNQLGRGLHAFADHPDQWALLAAHPELAAAAVDEVMRRFPAVGGVSPRQASADVELPGLTIPAGTVINVSTLAANHDPAVYGNDAERFDISLERPATNLTFGGGPHLCLGINLAKAEMQEAYVALATRLADLSLIGEPVYPPRVGIYGPDVLNLAFTASA